MLFGGYRSCQPGTVQREKAFFSAFQSISLIRCKKLEQKFLRAFQSNKIKKIVSFLSQSSTPGVTQL